MESVSRLAHGARDELLSACADTSRALADVIEETRTSSPVAPSDPNVTLSGLLSAGVSFARVHGLDPRSTFETFEPDDYGPAA
jgi:hypothetical protein